VHQKRGGGMQLLQIRVQGPSTLSHSTDFSRV
jgi:hypothetical protein